MVTIQPISCFEMLKKSSTPPESVRGFRALPYAMKPSGRKPLENGGNVLTRCCEDKIAAAMQNIHEAGPWPSFTVPSVGAILSAYEPDGTRSSNPVQNWSTDRPQHHPQESKQQVFRPLWNPKDERLSVFASALTNGSINV